MLTGDYPLLTNATKLVTSDIERLCRTLRLIVMTSVSSAVIHGHTHPGKSSSIKYLRLEREVKQGHDGKTKDCAKSPMDAKKSSPTRQPTLPKGLSDNPALLPRTR